MSNGDLPLDISHINGSHITNESEVKVLFRLYFPFCLIFFEKFEQNGEYSAFRAKSEILFVIFLL